MGVVRLATIASTVAVCAAVVGTARWSAVPQPSPTEWRTRFAKAALQIPFDKDAPPQFDSAVAPEANVPRRLLNMRIAAARTRDSGKMARIDFRITSDSGYPRLGIAPGINYVWKDLVDGRTRFLVIPANPTYPTHWLVVQSHTHLPAVKVPRLVIAIAAPKGLRDATRLATKDLRDSTKAFRTAIEYEEGPCASCTDDPMSWCLARDTVTRVNSITEPLAAFGNYFARNKVAWEKR